MQETKFEGQTLQKVFTGKDHQDLVSQMDEALRPGEEVVRRRELSQAEFNGLNRHERRKVQALVRRATPRANRQPK